MAANWADKMVLLMADHLVHAMVVLKVESSVLMLAVGLVALKADCSVVKMVGMLAVWKAEQLVGEMVGMLVACLEL